MDDIVRHLTIASDKANTRPEIATANALAAIGILLEQLVTKQRNT